MFGHWRAIIVQGVKARLEGLGRRLVAYTVLVGAAILLLWLVFRAVIGFVHMLIFIALVVFALYAITWALRTKDKT
jgi:hypothetical protein